MGIKKTQLSLALGLLVAFMMLFQNCSGDGYLSVYRDNETLKSFGEVCDAFAGENLGTEGTRGICRVTAPQLDHDFDDTLNRIWYSETEIDDTLKEVNGQKYCEYMYLSDRVIYRNATFSIGTPDTDYLEYDELTEEWGIRSSSSDVKNYTILETIECLVPLKPF